jgi:rhamnosyltransferase
MQTDPQTQTQTSAQDVPQHVAVIYLAYHPAEGDLQYVNQLAEQVSVIVVSNSGEHDFGSHIAAKRIFQENVGVGAGYNAGIEAAHSLGATHVMFHDQDSRLDAAMLTKALDRLSAIDPQGNSAALSLNPIDLGTNEPRTPRFNRPKAEGDLLRYREVQFSGLIAPMTIFDSPKPFSEYLFVDLVDFEWCWRMAKLVRILRDLSLTIGHQLGGGTKTILGAEYSLPSTSRFYFQFRNFVVLSTVPYVPTQWKFLTAVKYALRTALLPKIDPQFKDSWKQSARGIRDGRKDRTFARVESHLDPKIKPLMAPPDATSFSTSTFRSRADAL